MFSFTISSFQSKLQFSELSPAGRRGVSQWSNNDMSRAFVNISVLPSKTNKAEQKNLLTVCKKQN